MKHTLYRLGLLLILPSLLAYAQSPWVWSHPRPTGLRLNGCDFRNGNTGFIVGNVGLALKTEDGLTTTSQLPTDTFQNLYAVKFASDLIGVAVGESATIRRTSDGGASWRLRRAPSGVTKGLYGISSPPLNPGCFYVVGLDGRFIKSTNPGNTVWQRISTGVSENLFGIDFPVDSTTGYCCGANGKILKTTDGGNTWFPLPTGVPLEFRAIHFPQDNNTGYACAQSGQIWRTRDGGNTYDLRSSGTISNLKAIRFANNSLGITVGDNGAISRTTDGGETWQVVAAGVNDNLYAISFISPAVYVFGENGTILKSTDDGATWTNLTYRLTDKNLKGISAPEADVVFAFGENGIGLKTLNGGNDWNIIPTPWSYDINDVFFFDVNTGFVCGALSFVAYTLDGGSNWIMPGILPDSLEKNGIHGAGSTVLTVGRNGSIMRWRAGNWQALSPPTSNHLYGVFMIDDNNAWICGTNGYIAKTSNGGTSWTPQSSGTGVVLYSLYFVNSSLGFCSGEGGVILKTTNGGTTWTPLNSGTTRTLYAIGFVDDNNGWAVGAFGTVLRTTDSGTTWTNEEISCQSELRDLSVIVGDTLNMYTCGNLGAILKRTGFIPSIAEHPKPKTINTFAVLSPNPNQGEFVIRNRTISQAKIYDALGKLIKRIELNSNRVVVKNLDCGVYFLETDKERIKFVISR